MHNKIKCLGCKRFRQTNQYRRHAGFKSGYDDFCNECREDIELVTKKRKNKVKLKKDFDKEIKSSRDRGLRTRYGITEDDYNKILKEQNYCCAICLQHESNFKYKLGVDHCHKAEKEGRIKIRGLLCTNCNQSIGMLLDNPIIIRRAADYIERNE